VTRLITWSGEKGECLTFGLRDTYGICVSVGHGGCGTVAGDFDRERAGEVMGNSTSLRVPLRGRLSPGMPSENTTMACQPPLRAVLGLLTCLHIGLYVALFL